MGGVSIGSRSSASINTMNPASYSSVDSMTFMFDVGASALMSHFSQSGANVTRRNANLEYITMQFPLTKWMGFSAGVLPYSFVGYDFYSRDTLLVKSNSSASDSIRSTKSFIGSGGFTQVYTGLSVNLFKHISLGINAYYMFGTVTNYRGLSFASTTTNTISSTDYTSTTRTTSITAKNFRFRFGAQFYNTFDKVHDVALGVIYEPKTKLGGGFSQITTGVINDTIDVNHPGYTNYRFELPALFGVGLNYCYNKKLTIGIDYSVQQWKDVQFFSKTDTLSNRSKLAVGFEYQPNYKGRYFSQRIRYRAGFNVSDSYYKVNGVAQPKNYSLTCGLGLPLYNKANNSTTMLNASFEYGKIGSTVLSEDYYKFTLSIAFNEHWFMKRKL